MKLLLTIVLALAFMPSLRSQIIEVTAEGTVVNVEGSSDFGVQPGDLFTETFEINSATPGTADGMGVELYDGAGADSVTAGTFSMSSPDAISVAQILSNVDYGYQLRESFNTTVPVYADISLLSSDPAVAPTSSLSSISKFPLTDFGGSGDNEIDYVDDVDDFGFAAEISSYTVTTIAAPEPSSWALGLIALGSVFYLRRPRCLRLSSLR